MVIFIDGRPCGSYTRQKDRITRKELNELSTHIANYKNLTMDELCSKLKKVSGSKLKKISGVRKFSGRPCSSRGREKNRITRAELMKLASKIEGYKNMTMDELCAKLGFRRVKKATPRKVSPKKRARLTPKRKKATPKRKKATPKKRPTPRRKVVKLTPAKNVKTVPSDIPKKIPKEGFVFKYKDVNQGYSDTLVCDKKLGGGGYGNVYRCISDRLGKKVALKIMRGKSKRTRDEVERELTFLKAAAPYKVYAGLSDGDKHFLVTDYIEGDDLFSNMGKMTGKQMLNLAETSLKTLSKAHAKNIVHLDLKPENILVSPSKNESYIVDWGVSCFTDDKKKYVCEAWRGTQDYVSPWLTGKLRPVKCQKEGDQFKRNDLWALGVTLVEGATGMAPHITKTKVSFPDTGSSKLNSLVERLLDLKKPCLTAKDLGY